MPSSGKNFIKARRLKMRLPKMSIVSSVFFSLLVSAAAQASDTALDLKFAGALEFSDKGTLFVGDNYNGAIYSFDMTADSAPATINAVSITDIDTKMADVLGVGTSAIEINDMAAHPVSGEVFISVSRVGNYASRPVVLKVTQDSQLELLDLSTFSFTKQELAHYPDQETTFKPRGLMGTPASHRDLAKGQVKLSSLAIMDLLFHNNELFVSGVAYDDFLSTLRRIPFPFDGTQSAANVEMYHIAHDQYETRAPVRAMAIHEVDGKDQLIAAYTCSPLVMVPLDDIVDGAKIAANTLGDMGNGQPIDMISYKLNGEDTLFVTNNSRSPQIISVAGLNGAKPVTDKDFERGGKMDTMPIMPYGPVGKTVMFDGMSLHIDQLSDNLFVSITRDGYTGSLNLDANASFFPNRLHNFQAEFDFPQYVAAKAK